jgi:hypothetical protein
MVSTIVAILKIHNSKPTNTFTMDSILKSVPNTVLIGLAAVGFVAVSSKVISYIVLLLNLFVLSGTSVSSLPSVSNSGTSGLVD